MSKGNFKFKPNQSVERDPFEEMRNTKIYKSDRNRIKEIEQHYDESDWEDFEEALELSRS